MTRSRSLILAALILSCLACRAVVSVPNDGMGRDHQQGERHGDDQGHDRDRDHDQGDQRPH
jgi:hypothetical protein